MPDATPLFTLAGVLTHQPSDVGNLIRRVARRSGKRLGRRRDAIGELKWRNASQRFRADVLSRLAQADVEIYALTVRKIGRRVEDSPENYAALVCELLEQCWTAHPNVALTVDRRFTSAAHRAAFDTFVFRRWPAAGVLSIAHVDSQRAPLVQLADFAAGGIQARHGGDTTIRLAEERIKSAEVEDWPRVKARGTREAK